MTTAECCDWWGWQGWQGVIEWEWWQGRNVTIAGQIAQYVCTRKGSNIFQVRQRVLLQFYCLPWLQGCISAWKELNRNGICEVKAGLCILFWQTYTREGSISHSLFAAEKNFHPSPTKQDHIWMNVPPDQAIILGLQICLDHKSLSSIGQKILMILHPPPPAPFLI